METLLEVRELVKTFPARGRHGTGKTRLRAVDGVSFTLARGETLGLVGESGCGKSTTGKLLLRLLDADGGAVLYRGRDLLQLTQRELLPVRRELQMIFQDPYSSLNPRLSVAEIVAEPLVIHQVVPPGARRDEVVRLLETVGLGAGQLDRYPHEFSGGQRQRIGIARALASRPQVIVADEPVSALDLSIQAQVLNLLQEIQTQFGLTYLFIAHDLAVIEQICDRVAVMYLGRIVELAPADALYAAPRHPYSEALLDAVPVPDPARRRPHPPLAGEVPPTSDHAGCPFQPRCRYARPRCGSEAPPLLEKAPGHFAACHYSELVGSAGS